MARHIGMILDEVLALSEKDRAEIAHRILVSLDGPPPGPAEQEEIDAAWAAEAERRDREIDEGQVKMIPGEEILKKLRAGNRP